ncbi:unnamed protein product [Cyclocybe aegerita]|uniref:Protein kinase domain-containing protein n=1 Tax=Cyclocybe aegerita TaxID=1973307 RepID=A0A8S0XPM9_CYCAE|nr:unnamed protein product [Cyclocybe aegerita]
MPLSPSSTAERSLDLSPSQATLKASFSCTPIAPSVSRSASIRYAGTEISRMRSPVLHGPAPPPVRRGSIKMSHSTSFGAFFMSRTKTATKTEAIPGSPSISWLDKAFQFIRPWEDHDEVGAPIPEEQKLVYQQTETAVYETLKRVAKVSGEIALDALFVTLIGMQFVPIPALQRISEGLVCIWKQVKHVSLNRVGFLRLTQTCTLVLDSIHQEVEDASPEVLAKLAHPLATLEESFDGFLSLVTAQNKMPFLARYVRRDETTKAIADCHQAILGALALFNSTVQLRIYQAVFETKQMCSESFNELKIILEHGGVKGRPETPRTPTESRRRSAPDGLPPSSSHKSLRVIASPSVVSRSTDDLLPTPEVVPVLQKLQTTQGVNDAKSDIQDLRAIMRAMLEGTDDQGLLRHLGITPSEIPEAIKTLQRSLEQGAQGEDGAFKDTLHQEFVESGIEALRRMNTGFVVDLPQWTITKYEVDMRKKIGVGQFSDVFQGTWNGRIVAIKVLSQVTPSDLFVREIKVWNSLKHPNILRLYGASSSTGEHPWFFVSPYMKHGNLVEFLRKISARDTGELNQLGPIAENLPTSRSRSMGKMFCKLLKIGDTYRILGEIAKGMAYLHEQSILHGDLKASNILVDDNFKCVISDFGQSEMKSEICRITGQSMQNGTLRWKAPELLDGSSYVLTSPIDIFAYAIVCIEVLTMGELPWGHMITDEEVRHNVLENKRPSIPPEFTSPLLHELIEACWHQHAEKRMPFREAVSRLERLKVIAGDGSDPCIDTDGEEWPLSPALSSGSSFPRTNSPTSTPFFEQNPFFEPLSEEFVALPSPQEVDALRMEDNIPRSIMRMPEPIHFSDDLKVISSKKNAIYEAEFEAYSDETLSQRTHNGRDSPIPTNPHYVEARNERRYRFLLDHEFNSSLTLPLWDPSPVQIGDVGYLKKPAGRFITLFNALKPPKTLDAYNVPVRYMSEFGNVAKGSLRLDRRSAALKGFNAFSGFLTFKSKPEGLPTRRQSFRLRSGQKSAHIYTETPEYLYMKKLDAPKAWFKAHCETILNVYGKEHNIQREDIFLVISLLRARDYGLLVSHRHPDGQAHFHVFPSGRRGRPWGEFTSDTSTPGGCNGPSYEEVDRIEHDYASKVSVVHDPPKAVLLGKLRFKPDSSEPTTSK